MQLDFYDRAGIIGLGTRLRRISELFTQENIAIYELHELDFEPRWFAVFYLLVEVGPLHVSDLADRIGQSHAAVSQVTREMKKRGLLLTEKDARDGRKQLLSLSKQGQAMAPQMKDLYEDVYLAAKDLVDESGHDLWSALQALEEALERRSLLSRVKSFRKQRLAKDIEIVDYSPQYAQAFRDINVEWIQQYFTMEEADYKSLDHPQTYIIDPGGHILVALFKGEPVGVVALVKMQDGEYELAKMGVRPKAQGMGLGWLLSQALIEKARNLGAHRLYLESNTTLGPAIQLYYKLGFKRLSGKVPTPYARSNIQMEMLL